MSVKGGKKAAFGALIRIKCVNVDTTLPIFTGVWTTPGLTSQPKKKRGVKPQQCRVCAAINTPTAVYCSNCGTPLSEEGKVRMDSLEDRIRNEMLSNPEFVLSLASAMKKMEEERLQASNNV